MIHGPQSGGYGSDLRRQRPQDFARKQQGLLGANQPQQKKIMNPKKLLIAFIAAFVFIFLFEFVLHAKLLHNAYLETSTLWRTEEGFSSHFPLLLLGQAIIAFFFTMIFASGFGGGGSGAGVKFGIMFAFVGVGANLIQFAVQPLTTKILMAWSVGGLIEFAIVGAIVGTIYKPSPSA
jgi:hypothetical protein